MFSACISSHECTDLFLEPTASSLLPSCEKVPLLLRSKKSLRDFRRHTLQRVRSQDQFATFAKPHQTQNAPDEWRNFQNQSHSRLSPRSRPPCSPQLPSPPLVPPLARSPPARPAPSSPRVSFSFCAPLESLREPTVGSVDESLVMQQDAVMAGREKREEDLKSTHFGGEAQGKTWDCPKSAVSMGGSAVSECESVVFEREFSSLRLTKLL